MRQDANGTLLDVGRRTRTVPPALRRALEHRDRGCRFPGCSLRLCDGHHVRHWADGGETKLENLVLLCRRHHRAVHEEGFRVVLSPTGAAHFYRPDGRPIVDAPRQGIEPPAIGRAFDDLASDLDPNAAMPNWDGHPLDLGAAIDGLWSIGRAE